MRRWGRGYWWGADDPTDENDDVEDFDEPYDDDENIWIATFIIPLSSHE